VTYQKPKGSLFRHRQMQERLAKWREGKEERAICECCGGTFFKKDLVRQLKMEFLTMCRTCNTNGGHPPKETRH
jgi:hypothetical protein